MRRYIALVAAALVGCQNLSSHLTPDEFKTVVALAKDAALTSGALTPTEEAKLDSVKPVVAYYFVSRPVADYSVRWLLDDGEVVVSGRGDILSLANASTKVKRL